MNDRSYSDAMHANGRGNHDIDASPPGQREGTPHEDVSAQVRPVFLSELARAMQEAADRESERIAAIVTQDAATHIEQVRARAALETDELRRLAEEDVARIENWTANEVQRIRSEANDRIAERHADLETYLGQHDAVIDAEIVGVEGAVDEYKALLSRFFVELAGSGDPTEIVRQAVELPTPPDLDTIRANARARATARFAAATVQSVVAAVAPEAPVESEVVAPEAPVESEVVAPEAPVESEVVAEAQSSAVVSYVDPLIGVMEDIPATRDDDATVHPADAKPPIGVMADEKTGWESDEPVTIGSTVDHTSAAVRLLRSVAPWTAPSHEGDRQPPTDGQ